jgi:hypothetical protein
MPLILSLIFFYLSVTKPDSRLIYRGSYLTQVVRWLRLTVFIVPNWECTVPPTSPNVLPKEGNNRYPFYLNNWWTKGEKTPIYREKGPGIWAASDPMGDSGRRIKQEDTLSFPQQFTLTIQLVGFSKILIPVCQITHRPRRPYVSIYLTEKL